MEPSSEPPLLQRRPRAAWVLVSLAAAVVLAGILAPAGSGSVPGPAPTPLPAELDTVFLHDLVRLTLYPPEDAVVEIVPPGDRSSISSWYWTMAAFRYPELVWTVRHGRPRGDWAVCPADLTLERPWRKVRCEEAWCLWHR